MDYCKFAGLNDLLKNNERLHTTPMGVERIKRNLGLNKGNVIEFCSQAIQKEYATIERRGKNWYIIVDDTIFTVNANSFTIITAHKL